MKTYHKNLHGADHVITRYSPGDPEPEVAEVTTVSGRWYRNGRGWQHELALTDMGDITWDELLKVFGAAFVWEEER